MSSKTREKLIDTARLLFIRNGVENTTISDIANASDKGRRTIYTYFKNKREIYKAVVERESDNAVKMLRQIVNSDSDPSDKLRKYFEMRLFQTRLSASPFSSLKSLFSGDFRRSDLIRKKTYEKEEALLFEILDQGIEAGEFDPEKCSLLRNFLHRLITSLDLLSSHEDYPRLDMANGRAVIEFVMQGIAADQK